MVEAGIGGGQCLSVLAALVEEGVPPEMLTNGRPLGFFTSVFQAAADKPIYAAFASQTQSDLMVNRWSAEAGRPSPSASLETARYPIFAAIQPTGQGRVYDAAASNRRQNSDAAAANRWHLAPIARIAGTKSLPKNCSSAQWDRPTALNSWAETVQASRQSPGPLKSNFPGSFVLRAWVAQPTVTEVPRPDSANNTTRRSSLRPSRPAPKTWTPPQALDP